jgi:DNA (cytosine-5)-methyltransferase 1
MRMGFEAAGGRCAFSSEWNPFARRTYAANFGSGDAIAGDVRALDEDSVPDHDVLLAGFPCQPFSIAGVSKKNALGRPHGFACATQGTLFFDVARILAAKRPRAFLLENVKNLVSHDRGRTFRVIRQTLEEELGYAISWRVLDAAHFVPQHRERILIAGFREPCPFSLESLVLPRTRSTLRAVLHAEDSTELPEPPYTLPPRGAVNPKYVLTHHLWSYLQAYAAKHRAAGNGFGFGLVDRDSTARTLSARYYKDGSEILVSRGPRRPPRRLTPRECARLMGFPSSFHIPVSDTQAYKQFGNSVAVPVIAFVAAAMRPWITHWGLGTEN